MFVSLKKSLPFIFYCEKHCVKRQCKLLKCNTSLLSQIRTYSDANEQRTNEEFRTFEQFVRERRFEARRSFVVQVFSEQSCWDLYDYCCSIAPIKFMQHYSFNNRDHFVIAELVNDELDTFLRSCRHLEDSEALPIKSPFIWFKTGQERKKKKTAKRDDFPSNKCLSNSELFQLLSEKHSLSEQMQIVYEKTRLDEVGIRLRFITARQVELALSGLFPNCSVLPFGSSVNGFGKGGCDLDLGLRYAPASSKPKDSRLVFQTKEINQSGRPHIQRQMEMLADILHLFLPGCSNVRRILKARVPIVKYCHDFTSLECDLSVTDLTGVYMSEMLWLYGNLDCRVRPLVFTVRRWAESVGLTSPIPGKSITNFTLTALAIFYLQIIKILPSHLHLVELAGPEDSRFAGEVNCTFARDITFIPTSDDKSEVGTFLNGFFEYFSNFDFERYGVCLRHGKPVSKPDHSPLYLVNPLEPSLNVARNLSLEELTRLKVECRNASWLLQSSSSSLISLLKPLHLNPQKPSTKTGKRLVSLKNLFNPQPAS